MAIRPGSQSDLPDMVALIEAYRLRLAEWRPVFWKTAKGSDEMSTEWFAHQMMQENILTLINEDAGKVNGFLIATLIDAPPVYDVPGKTCMIDDFTVKSDALWSTVGQKLLAQAKIWAKEKGAIQVVVVTPSDHEQRSTFMIKQGLEDTTTWWVGKL